MSELLDAPWATQKQPAAPLPDAPWEEAPAPQKALPNAPWAQDKAEPPEKPIPGFFQSLSQGAQRGLAEAEQSYTTLTSSAIPTPIPETSGAAQPYGWGDILQPSHLLSKTAYQAARAWPTLAGGYAGSQAGAYATRSPWGSLAGGVLGQAVAGGLQAIGPTFAAEAQKTPNDLDGAWDRARTKAIVSGAFSGASWLAFGLPFLNGPVKNIAFQTLAAQPALSMAERGTMNKLDDRPLTEGMGEAYAQGAAGTAIPMMGHIALTQPGGNRGLGSIVQRTPAQNQVNQSAQQRLRNAAHLDSLAALPGQTSDQVYSLRVQAEAERATAQHETWLSNIPPELPKMGFLQSEFYRLLNPEAISEKAQQAGPLFGKFASERQQDRDSVVAQASKIRNNWDWVPFDDIRQWYAAYETGQPFPVNLAQKYPFMVKDTPILRRWLQDAYFDENEVGSKAAFFTNYFPHLFKDANKAQQLFQNTISTPAGTSWFQKARYYDMIEHALNNGLELQNKNPVDAVVHRLISGADMRAKMYLLDDLHNSGVAIPVTEAPSNLTNSKRQMNPWTQVDAPNGSKWLVAPDAKYLWENAAVSRGLWADPGIMGRLFRGWMNFKTAWVPIKLGLSLFHPTHVEGIDLSNNLARAVNETIAPGQQGAFRRLAAIPEALGQTIMDTALAWPIGTPYEGKRLRHSWEVRPQDQTPQQALDNELFHLTGTSPQLDERLRSQGTRALHDALVGVFGPDRTPLQRTGSALASPYPIAKTLLGAISKPIFEHWIPNLKTMALKREVEALARRRPDIFQDEVKMGVAMQAIGKQVDNRFGEMFYNSLFWNRTLKDAAVGSFLSLGWNLGFFREFVGGALEPATRRMIQNPTQALIHDVRTKGTNLLTYVATSMVAAAMMNYMLSGEYPQEMMDYILPKVGGLNTDGSQRRLSTPFYTREIPMASKNIEDQGGNVFMGLAQMLWHKMTYAPLIEAWGNRDYFGNQIRDEFAPAYQQAKQFGMHLLSDSFSPMTVVGAQRALQLSGKPHDTSSVLQAMVHGDKDAVLPFMGFGPAPAYASRSPLENRIFELGRRFVYPQEKPFQEGEQFQQRMEARTDYLQAMQRGDRRATAEAAARMAKLGMKSKQIGALKPQSSAPAVFQRLGQVAPSIQVSLLKEMTPEEFKVYYPKASKKTRADPAIIPLTREYYKQP